jgi:hypothetical protein
MIQVGQSKIFCEEGWKSKIRYDKGERAAKKKTTNRENWGAYVQKKMIFFFEEGKKPISESVDSDEDAGGTVGQW